MFILSRNQAKTIDTLAIERYGMPSIVLMENAGHGIADYLLAQNPQGSIVVCCGKGNNGGDGFVVARHLDNHNMAVHIVLCADPTTLQGNAKINYDIAVKSQIPITILDPNNLQSLSARLSDATWIIDALLGTGLTGDVEAPLNHVIEAINHVDKKVLSIDIPSGLDCDTGKPLGIAVRATYTASMVGYKTGFLNACAAFYLGHVQIIGLGTPRIVTQALRDETAL